MILDTFFTLQNGIKIPALGFGTWQISDADAPDCVKDAIQVGYRHIDSAADYGNERGVGLGVKKSGEQRENLFVTSKIQSHIKSYEEAKEVIANSLRLMDTPYLDLMLIHSPKPWQELASRSPKTYFEENLAVWRAMEESYAAGEIRALGVSNFEIDDIQNLLNYAKVRPQVNQIRVHIGHVPLENMEYCRENNILVEAFSPIATGNLKNYPHIVSMSEKYGVSVPQLAIRFDLQLNTLPLPKTRHAEYMRQNTLLDFAIAPEDMDILSNTEEIANM